MSDKEVLNTPSGRATIGADALPQEHTRMNTFIMPLNTPSGRATIGAYALPLDHTRKGAIIGDYTKIKPE